jgi:hypothetical protein
MAEPVNTLKLWIQNFAIAPAIMTGQGANTSPLIQICWSRVLIYLEYARETDEKLLDLLIITYVEKAEQN